MGGQVGHVDQPVQAVQDLPQLVLGAFAGGDVADGADHPDDLALGVAERGHDVGGPAGLAGPRHVDADILRVHHLPGQGAFQVGHDRGVPQEREGLRQPPAQDRLLGDAAELLHEGVPDHQAQVQVIDGDPLLGVADDLFAEPVRLQQGLPAAPALLQLPFQVRVQGADPGQAQAQAVPEDQQPAPGGEQVHLPPPGPVQPLRPGAGDELQVPVLPVRHLPQHVRVEPPGRAGLGIPEDGRIEGEHPHPHRPPPRGPGEAPGQQEQAEEQDPETGGPGGWGWTGHRAGLWGGGGKG